MRKKLPFTEYVSYSYQELLDSELKRAYRGKQFFSLALLTFSTGTKAGRAVNVLQDTLRDTDTVIRHGESGFLIFLPMTNKEGANHVVDRLRNAFESADYLDESAGNTDFSVKAVTFPEDGDNKTALLARLDSSL
ncbi:MAG: diguanylate cyclase [Bacillota bacterium]|nr:diguanylate cyclase [Bacillota bacterium]MDW7683535.1 diguanylate cyclase [Bacillota bacterium]